MVSVIGPEALLDPPPLLPQAAAARATAARPAASLNRRIAVSPSLRPADDRFYELPVLRAGRGEEVQIAALRCLLNGAGVERGPAAQVRQGRGRPGRGPAGQFLGRHLQLQRPG